MYVIHGEFMKKILYGFLVMCLGTTVLYALKVWGIHLGLVDGLIFTLVMGWLFSSATGLSMGIPRLNFDFSDYKKEK